MLGLKQKHNYETEPAVTGVIVTWQKNIASITQVTL